MLQLTRRIRAEAARRGLTEPFDESMFPKPLRCGAAAEGIPFVALELLGDRAAIVRREDDMRQAFRDRVAHGGVESGSQREYSLRVFEQLIRRLIEKPQRCG